MPLLFVNGVYAEVEPQIRYSSVESVMVEKILEPMDPNGVETVDASHLIYTFALFRVDEWADKCNFKLWLNGEVIAEWSIGFSATEPPGLQGIYLSEDNDLLQISIITSEFPYENQEKFHPVDGMQTYYFYRVHIYFIEIVSKGDTIRIAGDYIKEPTFEGSELTIFKIKNSKTQFSIKSFKFRTIKIK
jgi:hypothetical protein